MSLFLDKFKHRNSSVMAAEASSAALRQKKRMLINLRLAKINKARNYLKYANLQIKRIFFIHPVSNQRKKMRE